MTAMAFVATPTAAVDGASTAKLYSFATMCALLWLSARRWTAMTPITTNKSERALLRFTGESPDHREGSLGGLLT
jgi:hypothetical protein